MPTPVDFVLVVAKQLVDKPDEVRARWVDANDADDRGRRGNSDDDGFVELTVNPAERGKIIGRRGRTIDSLRALVTAAFGQGGTIGVEVAE